MRKYSVFAIAREAMRGNKGWEEQWSSPEPKAEYDIISLGKDGQPGGEGENADIGAQ